MKDSEPVEAGDVVDALVVKSGLLNLDVAVQEVIIKRQQALIGLLEAEIESLREIILDNAQQATTNTTLPEVEHAEP